MLCGPELTLITSEERFITEWRGAPMEGAFPLLGSQRTLDQLLFLFITSFVIIIIVAMLKGSSLRPSAKS